MSELNKTALLHRYGGIGDIFPVSVAAKQLHKRGWTVDLALREDGPMRQIDLFENCKYINKTINYSQRGPWGNRMVPYEDGYKSIETIYDDYDMVIDYMNIIEGNSTCKSTAIKKSTDAWQMTRNSNYVNWCDQHIAWAGIDPTSVPDDEKRPDLVLSKKEQSIVKKIKKQFKTIIGIHPMASSLARTWYQVKELMPLLQKEYPEALLIGWDPQSNDWMFHSASGEKIEIPVDSPIRRSMVVVALCSVYVTVDTGFAHVAEGLGVKHVCIYSTVPWWTRAKYYKHQTHIDMGIEHPEYYTFSLRAGDPLNIEEGMDNLTERESKLKGLMDKKTASDIISRELNTDGQGLKMEVECLNKKLQSFERIQSKAISSVTPEMVLEKIKELLNEQ